MRADLDRLMKERNIDWLIVVGSPREAPDMYYMTNGARITGATLLKEAGHPPILIHTPMERDEARKSGVQLCSTQDLLGSIRTINAYEYNLNLLIEAFRRFGVRGRVGLYGNWNLGMGIPVLVSLRERIRGVEWVEETDRSIFVEARMTKEPWEVERMRQVGLGCAKVFQTLTDYVQNQYERNGKLVDEKGKLIRIGDLRRVVHVGLAEVGLDDEQGCILAQGKDAAVPHSRGEDDDPVVLGVSTVFDLFPREKGGGYFFDMTRSFCIGYMPTPVKRVYSHVMESQRRALAVIKSQTPCARYDALVQGYFEERGYDTLRSKSGTQVGYVHGLGHGIGLDVHEAPTLRNTAGNNEMLISGIVFTVEPGLYFPDTGIGIRLEDTVFLNDAGEIENLTRIPKKPVIPLIRGDLPVKIKVVRDTRTRVVAAASSGRKSTTRPQPAAAKKAATAKKPATAKKAATAKKPATKAAKPAPKPPKQKAASGKKPVAKKQAAKKPVAKKPVGKKPAAKRVVARKPAAKAKRKR